MHACMHAYVRTYMHTYNIHAYMHVCRYVRTYVHACVYACVDAWVRACVVTHRDNFTKLDFQFVLENYYVNENHSVVVLFSWEISNEPNY